MNETVTQINALPLTVGSLMPSKQRMEEMADSLEALGEGAAVAVDTANKVVLYAETTHKVLTAVQMAGGVGALVQTGATILTQQTLKACAKQAAVAATHWIASGVASAAGNYALQWLPLTENQRYYLKIGLDAYQIFAFYRAAKARSVPGGVCFAAGTGVATGLAEDGSLVTRSIEDIQVGDFVLARNQYDSSDGVAFRAVTQVFRKTSDHLRILEIQGDDGNVEMIRTTDTHPFYVEGRGWVEAGELRAGDRLLETDGTWQSVLATEREAHPGGITVYNLEVEGDHTYFVEDGFGEADAVWVHNSCFRESVLARWSKRIGKRVHPNRKAHHVVPENDLRAQDLRELLGRNNVDVNDPMNGVPLLERYHLSRIHGARADNYFQAVRDRLRPLDGHGAEAMKNELDRIGMELFNGTFTF